jgi:20S proteasome alpha/beta subunit
MTVIVSVKINDGIVMAADSVSSFPNGLSYQHANKIVNLQKGLPIGAMVTGNGGIGNESIETLLKDLRRRFSGQDSAHPDWKLDPNSYTMEDVANKVREFIFTEKAQQYANEVWMQIRICGYSAGRPLSEVWEVKLEGKTCNPPSRFQKEEDFGPRWDGEYEALDRLLIGIGTTFVASAVSQLGVTEDQAKEK